jgi:putative flippase GtrA
MMAESPQAPAPGRTERAAEVARFFVSGGANMTFGFVAYALLVWAGLPIALALLVATVAGVFFNFFTFGGYTFRKLEARRLPRFLVAYGCIYLLNLLLLEAIIRLAGLGPIVAQLAALVVVAPTVYFVLRARVFQEMPNG